MVEVGKMCPGAGLVVAALPPAAAQGGSAQRPSATLHVLRRRIESGCDRCGRILGKPTTPQPQPQSQFQILHAADDRRRHTLGAIDACPADAGEKVFDRSPIGGQKSLALWRDAIALTAVFRLWKGVAHVLEPREGWVHHPRARAVAARHAFLDRLHQFVAVARLFADHGEHEQAQFTIIKQPPAAAAALSATSAMLMPRVPAIRQAFRGGTVAAEAVVDSVCHSPDIDRAISEYKIYRDCHAVAVATTLVSCGVATLRQPRLLRSDR